MRLLTTAATGFSGSATSCEYISQTQKMAARTSPCSAPHADGAAPDRLPTAGCCNAWPRRFDHREPSCRAEIA